MPTLEAMIAASPRNQSVDILVMVPSYFSEANRRCAIRDSWAQSLRALALPVTSMIIQLVQVAIRKPLGCAIFGNINMALSIWLYQCI